MSKPISLNALVINLSAGIATPEEQKQAAPIFQQMVMLGQAALSFHSAVDAIMQNDVRKVTQDPRSKIVVV